MADGQLVHQLWQADTGTGNILYPAVLTAVGRMPCFTACSKSLCGGNCFSKCNMQCIIAVFCSRHQAVLMCTPNFHVARVPWLGSMHLIPPNFSPSLLAAYCISRHVCCVTVSGISQANHRHMVNNLNYTLSDLRQFKYMHDQAVWLVTERYTQVGNWHSMTCAATWRACMCLHKMQSNYTRHWCLSCSTA